MNKVIVLILVSIVVVTIPPVYGLAGSLEQLQNETRDDTKYKKELQDYLTAHNSSYTPRKSVNTTVDYFSVYELEEIVKTHMYHCKNATPQELAETYKGYEFIYEIAKVQIFTNC